MEEQVVKKKSDVTILSSLSSPFPSAKRETLECKNLFLKKGIHFLEIDAGTTDPNLRERLHSLSGKTTYPQIFITTNGTVKYVGDFEEISLLEDQNKLDTIMGIDSFKIIPKRVEIKEEKAPSEN